MLEPLLPVAQGQGRSRTHMLREVMNGIRCVQRYGLPWDAMPKDLTPGCICYDDWRRLADDRHMDRINHGLVMADREKAGRASPTLAIIDAQSVKCDTPQGELGESVALRRGFDAAKRVMGRKHHVAVDTDARLLAVSVTDAGVRDPAKSHSDLRGDGGIDLVHRLVRLCPWVQTVVVDDGYKKRFAEAVQALIGRVVDVLKRSDFAKDFVLMPKRW